MKNKRLYVVVVLILTLALGTTAFASLTFTTDAITGTTASTIDLGAGNNLLLQTSGGNVGIGTTAPGEMLSLGLAGTTKGVLSLSGNTSGKIIIEPAAAAGTYTLTLPTSAGSANQLLVTDGTGVLSWASDIAWGIPSTTKASSDTLSATQVRGGMITNYGQVAENTLTLPTAASGYNFILVVGTSGAGALNLKAGASDKIYLDGTALDDADKARLEVPGVGDTLTCFSFQTGATAFDWICSSGGGAVWTDGGI